jgi:hypothetical protein
MLGQPQQLFGVRIDDMDVRPFDQFARQAGDQRRRHVAATDECNLHFMFSLCVYS